MLYTFKWNRVYFFQNLEISSKQWYKQCKCLHTDWLNFNNSELNVGGYKFSLALSPQSMTLLFYSFHFSFHI